jgi:hypothetical protein
MEEPGLVGYDRGENGQESAAVRIVPEYQSAFVATAGDVVQRTRKLEAERSRHVHSLLWIVMWQVET